jgi:hypothetical protein
VNRVAHRPYLHASALLALALAVCACVPAPATPPEEPPAAPTKRQATPANPTKPPAPHSAHHQVQLDHRDLVEVRVEVRVDEVPLHGLRFFALQVNFPNGAWAHGGLQRDPSDGVANWGGLLGGIDYDYRDRPRDVLAAIQNLPGRVGPARWATERWYRYRIWRSEREVLPPGDYAVLDEPPVRVAEARRLRRWSFSITDVLSGEEVYLQALYVDADTIRGFTYWTETGYGIGCEDRLVVRWRDPEYWRAGGEGPLTPRSLRASLRQSDCPPGTTTDVCAEDNGGRFGTVQRYGVVRTTAHGALLHSR